MAFAGAGRAAENVGFSAVCFQRWGLHSRVARGRWSWEAQMFAVIWVKVGGTERSPSGSPSYVGRPGSLWLRGPQALPLPLSICFGTLFCFKLRSRVATASAALLLQGFCNLTSQDVLWFSLLRPEEYISLYVIRSGSS